MRVSWISVRGLVLLATLVGCGRLDFARLATPDGNSPSGDASDGAVASGWTRIAAGEETTCGIYKSRAYCWGRGTNNEIGDGNATNRPRPTQVALPAGTVTDIVQGEGHGCAIVDDAVYCWGLAAVGNGTMSSATPVHVTLASNVTSISAGGQFACAVASGTVSCWGVDTSGALGNGAGNDSFVPNQVTLPMAAVSVECGNDHAMALLVNGAVYVWGHNDNGIFGNGSTTTPTSSQTAIAMGAVTGVQPQVAGWSACANLGGDVLCWGRGAEGELGNSQFNDSGSQVQVTGLSTGVTALATNGGPTNQDASCAVKGGAVSCWGEGIFGRLGNGLLTNQSSPQPVQNLPADIVELALGFEHSCARSSDGTVRCWGRGDLGQLGDGMSMSSLVPVVVPLPP